MESVQSAWQRVSAPIKVTLMLLGWPVTVFVLVVRLIDRGPRQLHWRAFRPAHLMWVVLAASVYLIGALPPLPHDQGANDAAALVLLGSAAGLCADWVKRRRQQKWRETGGRMAETPPAADVAKHRVTPLSDRVDENRTRLSTVEARMNGFEARLAGLSEGLITAMQSGGTPVPDSLANEVDTVQMPKQGPYLRVVRDNEQAG